MTDVPPVPVTWITVGDVAVELGIDPATAGDDAWLAACTDASNAWCFRRRFKSGYVDDPLVAPDAAVKMGATRHAARTYRARGSTAGVAEFQDQLGGTGWQTPSASLDEIYRLLAVRRPVAT